MDLSHPRVLSKINFKKALVFVVHRKLKEKKIVGHVKRFTGYQNLRIIKIDDLQKLQIKLEVKEGQVALVAIQKKQLKILAQNNSDCQIILPFSKGWVRLRAIGEHATFNFEMKKL